MGVKYSQCILIYQNRASVKILIALVFWFTKHIPMKFTLGIFLRYSYKLGNFHPDILIEAILIKKACIFTVVN